MSPSSSSSPASRSQKVIRVVRVLFGLQFVVSGLMGLLGATPPPTSASSAQLMVALQATGYFIPLLSCVQVAAGILLVTGRMVPLALVALAPVVVQVAAFRIFLTPPRLLPIAAVLLAGEIALAWAYRTAFAPLFGRA
jgi:uncharacterized membrane protein YphA (DoxX/SURF4 family)